MLMTRLKSGTVLLTLSLLLGGALPYQTWALDPPDAAELELAGLRLGPDAALVADLGGEKQGSGEWDHRLGPPTLT
jgi:hypothetical protein